ncbi:hypothetical protein GCM10009765_02790 [Fodinicola feengrottensis]|uniref:Uncharacterized protein n=1 Tax=Fodinicola feengrottensis TaxID=435914 RepID=A0ABN2FQP1_9ACTN
MLEWIWIHPYDRGGRLFSQVWPELEATYGKFHIRGPYSKPMEVALHDLGITDGRLI